MRLTRAQVREIDRRAIEELGIPGIVLMENAARAVADVVDHDRVVIVCGGGNNGGDGYAIARHLHNRDVDVTIVATKHDLAGDAKINADICRNMDLRTVDDFEPADYPCAIDALLGTGLAKPPRPDAAEWIRKINQVPTRIAVDVPSGIDCDTGAVLGGEAVRALTIVTFVAEKVGFPNATEHLGRVIVGDIGVPPSLVREVVATMPA
ncbi:MAG: NAD(P)H-hydrate epimerase [Planctomycetota bacterium]